MVRRGKTDEENIWAYVFDSCRQTRNGPLLQQERLPPLLIRTTIHVSESVTPGPLTQQRPADTINGCC